ncbi:SDR family NAD(P)-dependent oxidoreductase [Rhodoplanes sp. TEM]|uniref:SDR family NAD(P)-dependent oxidoreductase n=1 Tax=Rhodoplanes tepidamans TaxID=200616 RepID=A0ABT5JI49_RHOTP|nr:MULTISPECIES: SDR family NAD(P)-dependent oxidoreductase [Rhodoplanes]MDC7788974.1 SDR family NAD(P)-dependent oxidoreductase [Rhodoplanes tepidamans]MDC7987162.1 SDR family NAD(P)-dependent oxidoreductase [Rhodoplanes sp. TEM]MDQ0355687.1 NAD(P)-dependent dehydrogenase (short-subunit alcohol dehydrogenase family) [Rhodoplanes tepidamans]
MKTWFITGISRGLGLALARAALAAGDTVIGTVRSGTPELATDSGRLHVLTLDMADGPAVEAAVRRAFALAGDNAAPPAGGKAGDRAGTIDVIVNNAGYGLLGAIEQATDAEVAQLFAVDVFGPFRVVRAALPYLRAQGSGHIVNITSIAGRAPGPGAGLYSAAKHALEGLSASLAQEVAPLGLKVTAVAPGAFRTDFLSDHSIRRSDPESDAYGATVGRSSAAFAAMGGRQVGDPERAARAILQAVAAETPPLHLLLGSDALRRARAKLDAVVEEMNRWEAVTRSTDFPADAPA